eukprot:gene7465-9172_t
MSVSPPSSASNQDLILKLIFPPTSSIISKSILVQKNQRVSEVIQYASQLAGLQSGYSLYLPNSPRTNRGMWLEDDVLISTYQLSGSDNIQIKKRPGLKNRKNTYAQLKGFKEGKVQKLSSLTKIWNPRYLRLYSQRIVHSSSESDTNSDFISFADIINVDREVSRKYAFSIQFYVSPPILSTSTTNIGGVTNNSNNNNINNNNRDMKEYIFRCTNQSEMEEWVSSIRSLLKKSRPDLFLPPLSVYSVNINNQIYVQQSPNNSTTSLPPPPPSSPLATSTASDISINNENMPPPPLSPMELRAMKPRSFSFSLGRDKKKKDTNTPPQTLSEMNSHLEDEIKKVKDSLDHETKAKIELEKKYQKLKKKYTNFKKTTRSRSLSTPTTPEILRKDRFIVSSPFIIGGNRIQTHPHHPQHHHYQQQQQLQQQQQQQQQFLQQHQSSQSSSTQSQNPSLKDEDLTDNDFTSETFTSVDGDVGGEGSDEDSKVVEIKDLKDQLNKIRDKLQMELEQKNEMEASKRAVERELMRNRKMEEKRLRDYHIEASRQDDHLESMSEITTRLKNHLLELKNRMEIEERIDADFDVLNYS